MSAPSGRARRFALRLLLAAAVGALFFEGGLRALITSPWTKDTRLAREIGAPRRFAYSHEDLYWRFVARLQTSEAPVYEPPHDPHLGWTWMGIEPGTFEHVDERIAQGRRPVLLFGDSYSACLTPPEDCFQGLMERSELGDRYRLINYGVCGYGFDQICLMTRAAIGRYAGRDPAVVVGLLVDDDLVRSLLSLREYPKPRLRVEQGRVVGPERPVPSPAQYSADPEALPPSWAWAWLRQALREHPMDDAGSAERAEVAELTRALLRELVADLRAREVDFFFLLSHAEFSFPARPDEWRTGLVTGTLDELGAPWYDVREELARRVAAGAAIGDFYLPLHVPGGGHYDADGNAAAFAVLLRGLSEVCGVELQGDGAPGPHNFRRDVGPNGGIATFSRGPDGPFDSVPSATRMVLRAPRERPSSAHYRLNGATRRFRAQAWAHDPDGQPSTYELAALVDGRPAWSAALRAGEDAQELALDLQGAQALELRLSVHAGRGCVVLSDPTFE